MKIAVTGANSSVGQNLLAQITTQDKITVVAGVRSEQAKASLPHSPRIETRIISYDDSAGLAKLFTSVDSVVHLAGILMENRQTSYASANVAATAAVVQAAKHSAVKHLVFISVIGADATADNAYFRSKGCAEKLVVESGISASIIRTPILLGRGTAGAKALLGAASQTKIKILDGGNYFIRPLDIDDLGVAILHCCESQSAGATTHELAGPETISYRELVERTAKLLDREIKIAFMPIWLAKFGARISSILKGGGITPTVIDVITKDEVIQTNADTALGISLTSLQSTLEKITDKKQIS
jgi:NADH dehydrogenase|tara:strand:- start:21875 stop:22774 length:900 start_codon:yes stop_codon:yes gene_type:complete